MLLYVLIVGGMAVLFLRLPTSFLPEEDRGLYDNGATCGATQTRTKAGAGSIQNYYLSQEKANVKSVFTVNGFSFSGQGQNSGIVFISLKPWKSVRAMKTA